MLIQLLNGYKDRKKELAVFGEKDERTEFLERCLLNVDDFERDVIEKTCIDGVSIRQYAKMSGFSRETVTKERKRILQLLCRFFTKRFEKQDDAL